MTDDLDAKLTAWAESDAPMTMPGRIRRGAAARAAGRRALAWAGYLATKTGRKPADIMRSAINAYLDAAGDATVYLRDKGKER